MNVQKIVTYLAPGALTLACLAAGWSVSAHAFTPDAGSATRLVVTPEYKEGELLVKFKNSARRIPSLARRTHAVREVERFESMHEKDGKAGTLAQEPWRIARLKPGSDTLLSKEHLARHPDVESVELNYRVMAAQIPNDPRFSEQWSLHNIGQTGGTFNADTNAPEAWDVTTGSGNVVVAVIDTGVDYTHEDLRANMWINSGEIPGNGIDDDGNGYVDDVYGYDFVNNDGDPFDDFGHGTHVAGIIAAAGNDGVGIAGVNWSAKIMALKFLDAYGYGSISDAVYAIHYATIMGAKVMNNSWGGGGYSQALYDAIAEANTAGALFVAAAGNGYTNTDLYTFYPAGYDVPNVVVVTSTDHNDNKPAWSNYGATTVDLAAPGVDILSTVPRGPCPLCDSTGYSHLSGTSMATPHVAGVAALLLSQNNLSPAELKQRLMDSVDLHPSLTGLTVSGGRLNAEHAVRGMTPSPQLPDLALSNLTGPLSVTAGGFVNLTAQLANLGGAATPYALTLFALSKDPVFNWNDWNTWLGIDFIRDFAPASVRNISVAFEIPSYVVPGIYFIGGIVNFWSLAEEISSSNNSSNVIQIEVLAP